MEGILRQISLSELGDTVGTPASSTLIGSVRRNGVIQPIVLAELPDENGELHLKLIDGNRRVKAARSSGLSTLPAIVFTEVDADSISTLTLILNGFRSANYLTEFWGIRHLERQGFNEKDILSISGLSRTMVNHRTALSGLNRELFVALRNGKLFQTHAAAIAKLPGDVQTELAETFRLKKRIRQSDIDVYKEPKPAKAEPPPIADSLKHLAWSTQSSNPAVPYEGLPTNQPVPIPGAQGSVPAIQSQSPTPGAYEPETYSDMTSAEVFPPVTQVHPNPVEPEIQFGPSSAEKRDTITASNPSSEFTFYDATNPPTIASRAAIHMRNAVTAAQLLDFSREEFIEMAARIWDESAIRQSTTSQSNSPDSRIMGDYRPTEPFPDLATHKWDTGEG